MPIDIIFHIYVNTPPNFRAGCMRSWAPTLHLAWIFILKLIQSKRTIQVLKIYWGLVWLILVAIRTSFFHYLIFRTTIAITPELTLDHSRNYMEKSISHILGDLRLTMSTLRHWLGKRGSRKIKVYSNQVVVFSK